ncbi:MAG: ATP-dependent DNA ligase [Candidatus Dormibacteraceae bacterium]
MTETLPLDLEPMLAAPAADLPAGPDWSYEPKWDGFRIIAHLSPAGPQLISRGAKPMNRYFPEVVAAMEPLGTLGAVLDGELLVIGSAGLDFDALQQRVHPASSRVERLSRETPAEYVAFDLLQLNGEDLRGRPLSERRSLLEEVLKLAPASIHLTPYTRDPALGRKWFQEFEGAGLDGIIAKRWSHPYLSGKRGWVKIKHERTADCVVIGYRLSVAQDGVASILLGLYDQEGRMQFVGHTSGLDSVARHALLGQLKALEAPRDPEMGRSPGAPSRWSQDRSADWVSVRADLVCEVSFDKLQSGERFRHAARLIRWRPDRDPKSCTFDQIRPPSEFQIADILATRVRPRTE